MRPDLLKECVDALVALCAQKHKELGASVTAELDAVIQQLEHCLENAGNDAKVDVELRVRALETLSRCLTAATNLAEIIRRFLCPM